MTEHKGLNGYLRVIVNALVITVFGAVVTIGGCMGKGFADHVESSLNKLAESDKDQTLAMTTLAVSLAKFSTFADTERERSKTLSDMALNVAKIEERLAGQSEQLRDLVKTLRANGIQMTEKRAP